MSFSVRHSICTLVSSLLGGFALGASELPIGFQPIEYIVSTGAQAVDTGVVATRATRVVADYAFTAKPTSGQVSLFGWAGGAGILYGINADGKITATFTAAYSSTVVTEIAADTSRHQIDLKNGSLVYDGTSVALDPVEAELINNLPGTISLFARNYTWDSAQSGYNWNCKAKLYGLKVYNGETLVRNYVPCVRRSDLVVGLYDRVKGIFVTSATTAALQAPPDASLELEYVESDGSQYVNTGVVASKDLKTTVDYQFTTAPGSTMATIFGWLGSSGYLFGQTSTQLCQAFMASGYSSTEKVSLASDTNRHSVSLANGKTTFDEKTVFTTSVANDFSNYPDGTIALMARHYNWNNKTGSDGYSLQAKLRLYYCQMMDGSTPVRDYVPAKRISDGAIGLYDRVNHTFTAPKAGMLAAGPVVGEAATVRDLAIQAVQTDAKKCPLGVTVTFGMDTAKARGLYLAYGKLNAEKTALVNETRVLLAAVPAGSDELTVSFPAEVQEFFAKRSGGFRVLLGSDLAAAEGVPLAYAPVEYLQSAGSAYVETGVVATRDLRVVLDFQLTEKPSGSVALYGWAGGCCHLFGANATCFRYGFVAKDYAAVTNLDKVSLDANRHVVSVRNGMQELDSKKFATMSAEEEFSNDAQPGTITLLARHYNWNKEASKAAYDWKAKAKIYSCQMYDNGTLIRDYVPCVRLSDNKAGVVNRLDGSFLAALGSGATAGERLVSFEESAVIGGPMHGLAIIIR